MFSAYYDFLSSVSQSSRLQFLNAASFQADSSGAPYLQKNLVIKLGVYYFVRNSDTPMRISVERLRKCLCLYVPQIPILSSALQQLFMCASFHDDGIAHVSSSGAKSWAIQKNKCFDTHKITSAWRVRLPNRWVEKIIVLFPRNVVRRLKRSVPLIQCKVRM
jgi:hypothetical protein